MEDFKKEDVFDANFRSENQLFFFPLKLKKDLLADQTHRQEIKVRHIEFPVNI